MRATSWPRCISHTRTVVSRPPCSRHTPAPGAGQPSPPQLLPHQRGLNRDRASAGVPHRAQSALVWRESQRRDRHRVALVRANTCTMQASGPTINGRVGDAARSATPSTRCAYPQPTSHHRCWSDTRIARRTSGVGGRPAPELEVTPGGDDLLAVRCVHHRVDTPGVALPAAHHALGTPVVEQATAVFAAAHDLLRPAAGRYLCITGACTHTHTPPPPRPVFFTLPAPRSLCCIAGARVMGVCSEACGRQKYTVFSMSSCSCGASCICGAAADAPCAEPPPPVRALRPTPSSTANTTSSGSVPRVLLPQAPMRPVRVGLAPGRPGPRRPQWGSTSHLAYAMADAVRLTISR